jgi:hypothetical protein
MQTITMIFKNSINLESLKYPKFFLLIESDTNSKKLDKFKLLSPYYEWQKDNRENRKQLFVFEWLPRATFLSI